MEKKMETTIQALLKGSAYSGFFCHDGKLVASYSLNLYTNTKWEFPTNRGTFWGPR